jgi:hypothetical protein
LGPGQVGALGGVDVLQVDAQALRHRKNPGLTIALRSCAE